MKNSLPTGWRYAICLFVLLALAAIAAYSTISYIEYHPELQGVKDVLGIVNLMLLGLSMGFLFLSGALGLWGIRHAAEAESRRRIGLLVDAMDYVNDGVVAMDHQGKVVGLNPVARAWCGRDVLGSETLNVLFNTLSDQDVAVLCDTTRPREVEVDLQPSDGTSRTLRFRSEPAKGLNQVLISDVSERRAQLLRERQAAHLQLTGRIARGVAHDFNSILCVITGHATLLKQRAKDEGKAHSAEAILDAAHRGADLAHQLVELSKATPTRKQTAYPGEHVLRACENLRKSLGEDCSVVSEIEPELGPAPFSGVQLEQFIFNLGMLLGAREEGAPFLSVLLTREKSTRHAMVLTVTTSELIGHRDAGVWRIDNHHPHDEGGVICSVIKTLVEDVGGEMQLCTNQWGERGYRVWMPGSNTEVPSLAVRAGLPEELMHYVSTWSILFASRQRDENAELIRQLVAMGMKVEQTQDLVNALSTIEKSDRPFSGIILDHEMLGEESEVMLRALQKLQPTAGVVLLHGSPSDLPDGLQDDLVCLPSALPEDLFDALVRARERAGRRQKAAA